VDASLGLAEESREAVHSYSGIWVGDFAMSSSVMEMPNDQNASGRSLGSEELQYLREAIESGTLTSTKGTMVKRLQQSFAEFLGVKHAFACTSGSAAVHIALAAINPEPGDEVITTSVTDMGALTPILYQGAIPVFADVDPHTFNVTVATIRARITDRTKAIIVTHLFGNPCEMDQIMALAAEHDIPVIEDAAQAYGARSNGQLVGAIGSIGCFSLQQGKHITTGEGGLVVTNDDDLARRMFLFINKAWGYGDPKPDHYFLALNYRMSELDGAVALGQLEKLPNLLKHRIAMADALTAALGDVYGVETPVVRSGDTHVYWRYTLGVDEDRIPGGPVALGQQLKELGIAAAPRYIQKPAFQCEIFREQRTFGESRWPFTLAGGEALDYRPERFSGTFAALARVLVLPFNERMQAEHIEHIADAVRAGVNRLAAEAVTK
jgi:perosamine synthetase